MRCYLLAMVIVLAGCGGGAQSPSEVSASITAGPGTPAVPNPSEGSGSASPSETTTSAACDALTNTTLVHQAPELEARLPASVGGRALATWSLRGRCWLEVAITGGPSDIDAFVRGFEAANDPQMIELANLTYAVAGRSDTKADPPFFVFAAGRPRDDDEISLATVLLLGGASFHDLAKAGDLGLYERRMIAGKDVYVGTPDMLGQTEHQRGRPYLYQTDDAMFLLITDEDQWAEDALSQLH